MRSMTKLLVVAGVWLLAAGAEAQTVDVEVVNVLPIEVDVVNDVSVSSLPPVKIEAGEQIGVAEKTFLPEEVIVLQMFLMSNGVSILTTIPKGMVLRTITVSPGIVDHSDGLDSCRIRMHWLYPDIDPSSNGDILLDYNWPKEMNVSLNYPMPYPVKLPKGFQLSTELSRIGTTGFCEATVTVTGTVAPEERARAIKR